MKRIAFSILVVLPLLVAVACSDEFSTNALPPTSDGGTECKPNISSIQATVFARRCTTVGCHGSTEPASSLDLASPGVDARLVNVLAADCPGEVVVTPGKPDTSFLVRKLEDEKPTCGTRMPREDKGLPSGDIKCIRDWISSLPSTGIPDASNPDVAVNCGIGESACNGVCVDRQTDPKNCGKCANLCPDDKKFCSSGECLNACPGGTTPCSNACIVTSSDPKHCGSCTKACGTGEICKSGACGCGDAVTYKAQVEDAIIVPLCATANCHGRMTAPAGNLDLRAGQAYAAMVDKKATAPGCSTRTLVVPSDAAGSYLVAKLRGTGGICGAPMPKSGGLAPSQLAAIESWICNGAKND